MQITVQLEFSTKDIKREKETANNIIKNKKHN